jgi:hypothetical protein
MNIGEKDTINKARSKGEKQLKKAIRKECLLVAYAMIKDGQTREADEAVRVYKRLEEVKK